MKLNIIPQQIIPARFEVVFFEDNQTKDFIINPEPYHDALREDIQNWLDTHDPNHTLMFDRGDWGEGPAKVTISFSNEEKAQDFFKHWNGNKCQDISYLQCPHMRKTSPKHYACPLCGASFEILKP